METEHNKAVEDLPKASEKEENLMENQEDCCPGWQETFDASLDIIALISADFEILKLNKVGCKNLEMEPEELIGRKCYEVVHGLNSPIEGCPCEKALRTKMGGKGEIRDHGRCYIATASPILDKNNEIIAFSHTIKDITELKVIEQKLEEARKTLERKVRERTAELDRKNIAFQEIIAQIEKDKSRMKEEIKVNIERIVFPILTKLKKENDSKNYADLLRHHLDTLTSSYGITITESNFKLSPKEIEVCNLVKAGFTNKEISNHLNISIQTVEWHRKRIRRKLGIANNGLNLSSYLSGL